MRPRLVVKVIWVPLCGGVPAASITWATIGVVPFADHAVFGVVSVMLDPEGASSGTFSQATTTNDAAARTAHRDARRHRDNIKTVNILLP